MKIAEFRGVPEVEQGLLSCSPMARKRKHGRREDPIVLIHPFGLRAEVWKPVLPFLAPHEVHALAIPGHCGAEPLPVGCQYSVEHCVDLLEQQLDARGIHKAHLAGCSLGGWLALELARRGRARSVVAFAPGGGWELGSPEFVRLARHFKITRALLKAAGPVALTLAEYGIARDYMLRDAVAEPNKLTPDQARLVLESLWRCQVYDDVVRAMPKQAPAAEFETLPCPVRLVWGSEDRLLPMKGYSERWRKALPGAEWVIIHGAGHLPMFDRPRAVADDILAMIHPRDVSRVAC